MLKFRYATRTSQGARQYQEDTGAVWPGDSPLLPSGTPSPPDGIGLVALLADGMGGHAAGDVASGTICAAFLEHVLEGSTTSTQIRLASGLQHANAVLRHKAASDSKLGGMGTTCVGLAIGQDGAHWISVGDSPLWLFRDDQLERLNDDHSLAPLLDKLAADGKMDPDAAANDPRRHHLRSAVTGEPLDLIDASGDPRPLAVGDLVLLASDGILTLSEPEIRHVILASGVERPEIVADNLLAAVLEVGDPYQDNITLIAIHVHA